MSTRTASSAARPARSAPAGGARFAARARAARRRSQLPVVVGALVLLVLAGLALLVWRGPVAVVRGVDVRAAQGTLTRAETAQVEQRLRAPTGVPLARVDTALLAERVRTLPYVADVAVSRGWPSTLRVVVTHRTPVAALPRGSRGNARYALVDAGGTAYATVRTPPAGLPVVRVDLVRSGTETLRAALAVLHALPPATLHDVQGISASSPADVRLVVRGHQVVWGTADDTPRKAAVLRVLMTTKAKVYDVSSPGTPVTR